eukprot:8860494-Prorocentrum_lima.AAC.1
MAPTPSTQEAFPASSHPSSTPPTKSVHIATVTRHMRIMKAWSLIRIRTRTMLTSISTRSTSQYSLELGTHTHGQRSANNC